MKFDAGYMIAAANRPEIRATKLRSYELMALQEGAAALDIGCGPGVDTLAIAEIVGPRGRVVGVDLDPDMVAVANESAAGGRLDAVKHQVAGSTRLPFQDGEFDACRSERLLQHLSCAQAVATVREAVRVTRRGGRIVFVDSDWPSLSIHSADPAFERVMAQVRTASWTNGYAARGMPDLFAKAGLQPEGVDTAVLPLSPSDIDVWTVPLVRLGHLSAYRWSIWREGIANLHAAGTFRASLNLLTCWSSKP